MLTTKKIRIGCALVGLSGCFMYASVVFGLGVAGFGRPHQSGINCQYAESVKHDYQTRLTYLNLIDRRSPAVVPEADDLPENSHADSVLSRIFGVGDPAAQGGIMDSGSTTCLACHDGVSAQLVNAVVKNDPERIHRSSRVGTKDETDHPIGMDYDRYLMSRRGQIAYKDIAAQPKLLLFNGKVGCLTCHDMLSDEPGLLSVSDRNSGLCLSCHNA